MITFGKRDVNHYVISFKKDAWLLEPEDMRKEVEKELEKILSDMKKIIIAPGPLLPLIVIKYGKTPWRFSYDKRILCP